MSRGPRRSWSAVTASLLTAMALAGCSSDEGDRTVEAGGGGPQVSTADGKPIVIGLPESDAGNGFNQHHYGDAMTAWASDLNAAGGIGGRPVELVRCNDQGTPDGATACMREQVQNEDIVLGTGFSPHAPLITGPGFLAAGIPWLAAAGNSGGDLDGTGSTMCVVPTAIATYQALPTYAIEELDVERVSIMRVDTPRLALMEQEAIQSTEAAGGTVVTKAAIPLSTADFSPQVQQAIEADADLIVVATTIPTAQKIMETAASLGYQGVIGLSGGHYDATTQEIVRRLEGSGITFIHDAAFPDYRSDDEDVTEYRESLERHGYEDNLGNDQGAGGWASGKYLQKIFEYLGPDNITRESVMEALTTQTFDEVSLFEGPVGAANGTEAFPALGYIRTHIVTLDADGQKWADEPIDLRDLTEALRWP